MSEALHTPGPWVARPDPNAISPDDWCVGIGDSLKNIDKVAVCSERDAHLIAAAPDLLALVQESLSIGKSLVRDVYGSEFLESAIAAIARATGKGGVR